MKECRLLEVLLAQAESLGGGDHALADGGGGVPARVCDNCGEEYVDARVAARLLRDADAAAKSGARIQVRQYAAA